jgi:predicted GNAT family N-acyltransferase
VFVGEQGVTPAADRDGRDGQAIQVVALEGERVVGTCRVLVGDGIGRLGRMAVEPELRGTGIGTALLEEAHRQSAAAGAERVRLHAQVAARSLYERAGYVPEGDVFVEEGIEHVTMEKRLA